MNRILIALMLQMLLCSCLKDEPFKGRYSGFEPLPMNDGWEISTAEDQKINYEKLQQAYRLLYSDERFLMARSMLVIRNGRLVAEAYPHHPNDLHQYANIQSCTKSFTSIMMGVAIADGVDISVDDKLYDIYPDLFDEVPDKRNISLGDALTMQAGLKFDNDVHTLQLYQLQSNSARYVLSLPMITQAGTVMHYNDGAPHLVSKAIEVKTGRYLDEYARAKLFEPLDITHWKWERAKDGTTFGAFSLFLKPRDFARVGQLLLQNGMWHNRQIIDRDYLKAATSAHTPTPFNRDYGYYFWMDKHNRGYYAHGHGGQILLVVPSKNLVLLYTAWPYTSGEFFDDAFDMFDLIIDGCE
jgi:CubicO group peptidase (beta-lactamase class C family)